MNLNCITSIINLYSLDYLLTTVATCPAYLTLMKELESSQEIRKILEDNKDLFTYLSKNSGLNVTTLPELEDLYDTLFIEVTS